MENLLHEDFRGVKSKNSSDEALRRWRDVCGFVKNPKRRFRFTANLHKRGEAAAMRRTNQVSIFYYSSMTCCWTWIAPMIF
jgi:Ca2+-transporting ATPase